jgi:hypothetical protein
MGTWLLAMLYYGSINVDHILKTVGSYMSWNTTYIRVHEELDEIKGTLKLLLPFIHTVELYRDGMDL